MFTPHWSATMPLNPPPDFDFMRGRWQVRHRRLVRRLAACADWETFPGQCELWPLMDGSGNIDDNLLELPSGSYRAVTLRTWDASSGLWSIWWLDGRYPTQLDTPVRGRFENGIGSFYADDSLDGRAIRVRFLWLHTDTDTPRWEQAFSADGGQTWETNWEMDFSRQTPAASVNPLR
jgi:hypothetical protein